MGKKKERERPHVSLQVFLTDATQGRWGRGSGDWRKKRGERDRKYVQRTFACRKFGKVDDPSSNEIDKFVPDIQVQQNRHSYQS